jgi:DNA-binding CsgD family transcriptional regulator
MSDLIDSGSAVAGREDELSSVKALLALRGPSALLLEGDPGIGKTTIWNAGVEAAHNAGRRVMSCSASGAETQLSFAVLGDLLEHVVEQTLAGLSAPQRRALEVALLMCDEEGLRADPRAIGLGVLNALRALSRETPLFIAVDDVHWVDPASAAALGFALRRLRDEPVLVLASARGGIELPLDLGRPLERVEVGPLSVGALHRAVRQAIGASVPRRTLRRIHDLSAGNPFYAIELARKLPAADDRDVLALPESLELLVHDRLEALPESTRSALFDVAALAEPTLELLDRPALEPAFRARVVEQADERIRFTHPLLASAAYRGLAPDGRVHAHRRLAVVAPTAEERARHLALATTKPDERVAAELVMAARHAADRGAPATAAELLEHAGRVTAPTDSAARAERAIAAADAHLAAGDWERARTLLRQVVSAAEPRSRAQAAARLATWVLEDVRTGIELCERALADVPDDPGARSRLLAALCANLHLLGDYQAAIARAREAATEATRSGDNRTLAVALGYLGMFEVVTAQGDPVGHLERARELAGTDQRLLPVHPGTWLGLRHLFRDELGDARRYLEAEYADALEVGDDAQRSGILLHLCELEWRAGNWPEALDHAERGYDLAEQVGDDQGRGALLYARALVTGQLGRIDESRAATADGVALADAIEDHLFPMMHAFAAGEREVSVGQYEDALREFAVLDRSVDTEVPLDPGVAPYQADAIEALVVLGRVDEAANRAEDLDRRGHELDRPRARSDAARGRALVLAAGGDFEGALENVRCALDELERIDAPLAHARTQLVHGMVLRRARKRSAARAALHEAEELFERLGAAVWLERARAERARIGGRTATGDLTATERRVAELVAQGHSNKDVAAQLFITPRTVEGHLTRIYEKLSVRSRAELAHRLSAPAG